MKDDHPREQIERENFFSRLRKKLLGEEAENDDDITEKEFKSMVKDGADSGALEPGEVDMLINFVEFSDKMAHEIMTHRKEISAIDASSPIEETLRRTMEDGFSRYPVYIEDLDHVIGIFHIRDLVKLYLDENKRDKTLLDEREELLNDPYIIPETKGISDLLREMQQKKTHMALVVDEYGQTSGLVTMEDILEEIFGNIWDEHDSPDSDIVRLTPDSYMIDGTAQLDEVSDELGVDFDVEDIDTMNGFMTFKLGHIPEDGEEFETVYGGYHFKIAEAKNNVITKIKAVRLGEQNNE